MGQLDTIRTPSGSEIKSYILIREVCEWFVLLIVSFKDGSKIIQPLENAHGRDFSYIILNYQRMTECPLCNCLFIEGYQHVQFHIIICLHCFMIIKGLKQHRSYKYFSMLITSVKKQCKEANSKLKEFRILQNQSLQRLLQQRKIDSCFQPSTQIAQKSDRVSITTQDTQFFLQKSMNTQKDTATIVLQKCQETVRVLTTKMEPTKEKIVKSKQMIMEKAETIKDKYKQFRQQFRIIRAQLPPVHDLAKEAKQKLGSFLKFF